MSTDYVSGEHPDEALGIYTSMSARWDMARTSRQASPG